jgi:hypothetical protein
MKKDIILLIDNDIGSNNQAERILNQADFIYV